MTKKTKYCLTIAGLDPSGGAGATSDLRVFKRLGCYGLCALTALTPQNTKGVRGIHPSSKLALRQQLEALFEDFPIAAAKTGQIPTKELAKEIVKILKKYPTKLVIDPVMIPTRGMRLVEDDAVKYMQRYLLPLAYVITPNIEEASWLAGFDIVTKEDMEKAAKKLVPKMTKAVVITGGDSEFNQALDLFYDGNNMRWFKTSKRNIGDVHGSGCHYSSILTSYIAKDYPLIEAVKKTKKTITNLLDNNLLDPTGQMKTINS